MNIEGGGPSERRGGSERGGSGGESAPELIKAAGAELAKLVQSELALARHELEDTARAAQGAGLMLAGAASLGFVGTELVIGAMVAAGRRHPVVLAALGFGMLGAAGRLAVDAVRAFPPLLPRTRRRFAEDTAVLAEAALPERAEERAR